ncbi:alpha/beta fold hydrolase [Salinimonas chungwhensis]|uniref:alpha/beta fold hydrolase n=1 Tax=Salinimonas chungwhensis TaxID=265425 RepID=UPI000375BEE0|nr:alpha/beta fold hydrolase [Salinimonas chungwhensis]
MFDYQVSRTEAPFCRLVLAHGAGAGYQTAFMTQMADYLAARNIEVWRFNFPYMQTMQATGKRRPPDRMPTLETHFLAVLNQIADSEVSLPLFVGGKSMGGRVATHILSQSHALGAVVLGYPFHPPARPDKLRTEHFAQLSKPVCICQGERDTFGTRAEIDSYHLPDTVSVSFLPDGDHSLQPRRRSGKTLDDNMQQTAQIAATFMHDQV